MSDSQHQPQVYSIRINVPMVAELPEGVYPEALENHLPSFNRRPAHVSVKDGALGHLPIINEGKTLYHIR